MHKPTATFIGRLGTVVALSIPVILGLVADGRAEEASATPVREPQVIAWQGQEALQARPFDSADNPYIAQYTGLDRLLRQHVWAVGEELPSEPIPGRSGEERARSGYSMFYLQLDHAGWQLPRAESWRLQEVARQQADRRFDVRVNDWDVNHQMMVASLPKNDDLNMQLYEAERAARASVQPPVPDWLALHTSAAITPLPDGTFITEGSPGSWWRDYQGNKRVNFSPQARHNEWLRYSAAGELLGACPLHGGSLGWLEITAPQLHTVELEARAAGHSAEVVDGFMLVFSSLPYGPIPGTSVMGKLPDEPQLIAAYDWDGTPLDISQPLTRAGGYCIPLHSGFP